jgi:D-alanine-D-alanine ligase
MSNVGAGKVVVGVLYGGRNNEHEVSLRSAASVFKRLDRTKFDARAIYIDKAGVFHWAEIPSTFAQSDASELPMVTDAPEVVFLPRPKRDASGRSKAQFLVVSGPHAGKIEEMDVLMPMVHGNNAEDGTLQGLFECADIAYTGSRVLGSAIGMDKEVSKRLAQLAGLPIVPYRVAHSWDAQEQIEALVHDVERQFSYPIFVKPAREGSSVGVFKVKTRDEFFKRIADAFKFDTKILIEKAILAREIEFSVLQNADRSKLPHVSIPAEIIPTHEFYSYDAKYNDENGAVVKIPAEISEDMKIKMSALAQKVFTTLELEGYARVDLFLDRETGAYYLNEVNTLPGFTSISMFPKLFEMTHIPYTELITRIIELALLRNRCSAPFG